MTCEECGHVWEDSVFINRRVNVVTCPRCGHLRTMDADQRDQRSPRWSLLEACFTALAALILIYFVVTVLVNLLADCGTPGTC